MDNEEFDMELLIVLEGVLDIQLRRELCHSLDWELYRKLFDVLNKELQVELRGELGGGLTI